MENVKKLQETSTNFCASSYHFRDIKFKISKICYLQKVGHSHRVQFSKWHHSMANVKIYKWFRPIFVPFRPFNGYNLPEKGLPHEGVVDEAAMGGRVVERSHLPVVVCVASEQEPSDVWASFPDDYPQIANFPHTTSRLLLSKKRRRHFQMHSCPAISFIWCTTWRRN